MPEEPFPIYDFDGDDLPQILRHEFHEQREYLKSEFEKIQAKIADLKKLVETLVVTPPANTPTSGSIHISTPQGESMSITVDTTTGQATFTFEDDKGDVLPAPAGSSVAWSSDNTAVLTIDPASGVITPVAEGTANVTATISGVTLADGSPFPPVTVAVPVLAGAAVAVVLNIPSGITVDTTGAVATVTFQDDKGDDENTPTGAAVAYTTDNPSILNVDSASGALTPVAEGTANITATVTGVFLPDGVTPFTPATVAVPVGPGAPASGTITVTP